MHLLSKIIISSAIVLMTTSAAFSKNEGFPNIDLQARCRATQNATDALTGVKNPNAFDLCLNSENSAREKLLARWATTSALDKATCVHPSDYSPSYFEWLGCLDTRVYVQKMRMDHTEAMATSGQCPTVKWQSDGSISSVVACNLGR